ncbi:DegV family protein [Dehalogenimonas etheniformans]|nr:DegV family protein [Dehalogenimonas etheniformans]
MQIVVDSGVDLNMTPETMLEMGIHQVPLSVTFKGKTYREGVDIDRVQFYSMLSENSEFPVTSQPSPGLIAETYKALAANDPDILSIHMSSGLSGTYDAARIAAGLVPNAKVTHFDTKTLSVASGWQAIAAARAVKVDQPVEQVLSIMKRIGDATDTLFTLKELRYLIHGGRISHIKGLMASLLNIKPIIGVEKVHGKYVQMGQARTFYSAIENLVSQVVGRYPAGTKLRAQIVHAQNPDGADMLKNALDKICKCDWMPTFTISLVLGAHTGPSVVGLAFAPDATLREVDLG